MAVRAVHDTAAVKTLIEKGQGGETATISFLQAAEAGSRISLRAPYLVYYGVVDGEKNIRDQTGRRHSVKEGESLLVPPLQSLTAEFPGAETIPARWIALKIDPDIVEDLMGDVEEEASRGTAWTLREQSHCHLERMEGVVRVLRMMAFLFRQNPAGRDVHLDLSVRQLILHLLQSRARPLLANGVSRHSVDGGLAAAVQYIQNNLDRHISIDELVDVACMSKSTFYRHFNDEFDVSPLEYITQERVLRARELLSNTDNTVARVSHALGFSSTSYFIDMFKEHVGITPKQYQLKGDPLEDQA